MSEQIKNYYENYDEEGRLFRDKAISARHLLRLKTAAIVCGKRQLLQKWNGMSKMPDLRFCIILALMEFHSFLQAKLIRLPMMISISGWSTYISIVKNRVSSDIVCTVY